MNLTLVQWQEIDAARQTAFDALQKLVQLFHAHAVDAGPSEEGAKLLELCGRVEDAKISLPDTHPQSEWLGGDSDDPKNNTLKEPNCVGYRRRHFSREEIDAAGMICLGPCQWRQNLSEVPMPWCEHCQCYHHHTAPCIEK